MKRTSDRPGGRPGCPRRPTPPRRRRARRPGRDGVRDRSLSTWAFVTNTAPGTEAERLGRDQEARAEPFAARVAHDRDRGARVHQLPQRVQAEGALPGEVLLVAGRVLRAGAELADLRRRERQALLRRGPRAATRIERQAVRARAPSAQGIALPDLADLPRVALHGERRDLGVVQEAVQPELGAVAVLARQQRLGRGGGRPGSVLSRVVRPRGGLEHLLRQVVREIGAGDAAPPLDRAERDRVDAVPVGSLRTQVLREVAARRLLELARVVRLRRTAASPRGRAGPRTRAPLRPRAGAPPPGPSRPRRALRS